jgi:hypothetical protein
MTTPEEMTIGIYKIERSYQRCCFGDYSKIKSLNLASFLEFIEEYLTKAKEAYCGQWQKELPIWLKNCKEMEQGLSAPTKVYEELIKVMTLAGAALETYAEIYPNKWRINPAEDSQKWKE